MVASSCCRVEAEKDVAVRTSMLRASSASPTWPGPSLLCLPAVHSSPVSPSSQPRSPSAAAVESSPSAARPYLSVTDAGALPRTSAFGSFSGFRSSAISEALPGALNATATAAAQVGYTDRVRQAPVVVYKGLATGVSCGMRLPNKFAGWFS